MELVAPHVFVEPPLRRITLTQERPPFCPQDHAAIHRMQQCLPTDLGIEEAFCAHPALPGVCARLPMDARPDEAEHHSRFPPSTGEIQPEQTLATVNELLAALLRKVGNSCRRYIDCDVHVCQKHKQRNPEMNSSKKGKQWWFGMKAHIGVDAESGLAGASR
jgi:IS5 family transposase